MLYYDDFYNNSQSCLAASYNNNGCVNIQNELYYLNAGNGGLPTQQVQTAIQVAFEYYNNYLAQTGQKTDSGGNSCGGS